MTGPKPESAANTNKPAGDEPGALAGVTKITLHTRQAQRLFKGRRKGEFYKNGEPKPPIPGVYGFGNLAKQLQTGSMAGDPYADWHFVRIDTEFAEIETDYDALESKLDDLLGNATGFDVALHLSKKPATEEVSFFSPYSFKACHIVLQADRLMTKLLGANHYALVKRKFTEKTQNEIFARVRRLFAIPAKYRFTGTTRADFLPQPNARAQRAIEAHGAVPEAILLRSVEPAYGNWRSADGASEKTEDDHGDAQEAAADANDASSADGAASVAAAE